MTRAYDPFGSVLEALRSDLRNGVLAPGSPMVVMDLAKTLRVSATPVREALSRLSGEGLVEEHRGRGFSAPRLDPADLGSLHNLHGVYIATALIWREGRQERVILSKPERGAEGATARVGAKGDTVGYRQRALTEQLWIGVVEAVDNRALKRHQQQVNDSELDYLSQFAGAEASSAFRNAATDYHRRRFEASNLIAHCIRDTFHV
jgi:DNA-binding transcriptional MocR family regulator